MRIVAWNLGHQTIERPIRVGFEQVIAQLKPDILTLNEYVHGPSRENLVSSLMELGLIHIEVSKRIGKHNQVLIASRTRIIPGPLMGPNVSDADQSNFLHVHLPEDNFGLVGMRVPAYPDSGKTNAYWSEFLQIATTSINQRIIFIGDLNADPARFRSIGGRYLAQLIEAGWRLPISEGAWSYISKTGISSRIDHALISPGLGIATARYVSEIGKMKLTGSDGAAFSDHAALIVDLPF